MDVVNDVVKIESPLCQLSETRLEDKYSSKSKGHLRPQLGRRAHPAKWGIESLREFTVSLNFAGGFSLAEGDKDEL